MTKIENGKGLNREEKLLIEKRFVTRVFAKDNLSNAIRQFFHIKDVNDYNRPAITGPEVIEYVSNNLIYTGHQATC